MTYEIYKAAVEESNNNKAKRVKEEEKRKEADRKTGWSRAEQSEAELASVEIDQRKSIGNK